MEGGEWVYNKANPVVTGGQLWSQICDGTGKHCTKGFHDEGTPEIVCKDAGFFFVTFHGCPDGARTSARGVAKTRDFVHWEVDGADLPGDAIFSSVDCAGWNVSWANGTCVGGGEASIIDNRHDDGYLYQLIESPDISLACLGAEQNWVLGLLRSHSFARSGEWEQLPARNPLVVPAVKHGCYLQYGRLFVDASRGASYMEVWAGGPDGW